MISLPNLKALTWQVKKPLVWLYLAYAAIAGVTLHHYISWQSVNVVLGVVAMPVVITVQRNHKQSQRFAWVALLFAGLCLFVPVKTLLFLAIAFACFFITETYAGRMNLLPLLVVGIMSPVFQFASNIASFPLRLWLTSVAGSMMNRVSMKTAVAGNIITYQGNEYAVDPACMGLNMLAVALLLQLMLIAIFQKQTALTLNRWLVIALMGASFAMNMISNLFRIIGLVCFNVLPGTVMHDVVGIFCLLAYVVLPMIFVTKWTVQRAGKTPSAHSVPEKAGGRLFFIHLVLLATIGLAAVGISKQKEGVEGIEKISNEHALIYIKHIPGFYSADHHPGICWKGSGYDFKQIEQKTIDGQPVYTAIMENGQDKLYTAWWYDNGTVRTTSQFTWRWTALNGSSPFSLINVTTTNPQQLQQQIRKLFQKHTL